MELSPTELKARTKGLNRRQRRAQARESWDLLELWRDPEFEHLSRPAARKASWDRYWNMWRKGDLELAKTQAKANRKTRRSGLFKRMLSRVFGGDQG